MAALGFLGPWRAAPTPSGDLCWPSAFAGSYSSAWLGSYFPRLNDFDHRNWRLTSWAMLTWCPWSKLKQKRGFYVHVTVGNLSVTFGIFRAVDTSSYKVEEGEVLAIVGESGSGQKVVSLSIMGLNAIFRQSQPPIKLTLWGSKIFKLCQKSNRRKLKPASDIAMNLPDPHDRLNPLFHRGLSDSLKPWKPIKGGKQKELKARANRTIIQVGSSARVHV